MNGLIPYTQANIRVYSFSTSVKPSTLLITTSSFKTSKSIKAANPPLHGFSPIYVIENKWLGSTKPCRHSRLLLTVFHKAQFLVHYSFSCQLMIFPYMLRLATCIYLLMTWQLVCVCEGATEVQTVNDQLQKECQNVKLSELTCKWSLTQFCRVINWERGLVMIPSRGNHMRDSTS